MGSGGMFRVGDGRVGWERWFRGRQRSSGDDVFYISCRTAGELLNVSAMQASRWFFLLDTEGIIKTVQKGGTAKNPRKASRYKYIAEN